MKNNIKQEYDILIIGAGPCGITAAIYAKRAGNTTAMIEKSSPGGKVVKTSEIENYPGLDSILGPDLAMNFFNQTQKLDVPYIGGSVEKVEQNEKYWYTTLDNKDVYKSKAVIIATGTVERKIGVPGEDEFYGKGVSYCAVCDGAFFKDQEVVVVGGGLAALEEAMYLAKFASKIYVVHRRQGFRADEKTVEKVRNNNKIEFVLDHVVTNINGDKTVNQVTIKNVITNEEKNMIVNAIFPYIGADPISDFVKHLNITDEMGAIITDVKCATSYKGLYAGGDVRQTVLRQIATAVGDGAICAQEAIGYIDHNFE